MTTAKDQKTTAKDRAIAVAVAATMAAGDALAMRILQHPDQYPDLVPLALAVLDPVLNNLEAAKPSQSQQ